MHVDRNRYAAIMVGIGTVLADNPMLTCRIEHGRNPIRIICDTNLRTPLDSNIVKTAKDIRTILVTTKKEINLHKPYLTMCCEILVVSKKDGRINLTSLMQKLFAKKIDSVLLEGGGTLNFSALESKIIHKVQCYIAPKMFGGAFSKTPVSGKGFEEIKDCVTLKNSTITQIGHDILIESEVDYTCLQE